MHHHSSDFFTHAVEQLRLQANIYIYVMRFEAHSPGFPGDWFSTSPMSYMNGRVIFKVETGYTRMQSEFGVEFLDSDMNSLGQKCHYIPRIQSRKCKCS
jgi:hypothetical protein